MRRKATLEDLEDWHLTNIVMLGIIQFVVGFATASVIYDHFGLGIIFVVIGIVYFIVYAYTLWLDLAELKEAMKQ